jgi:TonB family protein
MGYQALLFCPDEKTARTVTQVLTELDFTIEPCSEPFAAVKKLTTQHFDAVVVDCDNEQNATLLFKSARNSASNQSSLAVAVVEGQAGVAKAFRIGANLVLTKPINVEQAKGTLRVARGLLRKGTEPPKAGTAATPAAQPAAPKPAAPPTRPTTSAALAAHIATRKPAPPTLASRPAPIPSIAASTPVLDLDDQDSDSILDAGQDEPVIAQPMLETKPAPATPVPTATGTSKFPWQPSPKMAEPMASALRRAAEAAGQVEAVPEEPALPPLAPPAPEKRPMSGAMFQAQGHSAAPARALEKPAFPAPPAVFEEPVAPRKASVQEVAEPPAERSVIVDTTRDDVPPPTFFPGAYDAEESEEGGGKTKALIIVAAVVLLASSAGYLSWKNTGSSKTSAAEATTPAASTPMTSAPAPESATPHGTAPAPQPEETDINLSPSSSSSHASTSQSALKPSAKPSAGVAEATEPEPEVTQRLIVKSDIHHPAARPNMPEAESVQAPSAIGMETSADTKALANISNAGVKTSKPTAQLLRVSQGVMEGLVLKRVQPRYPSQALQMRIQGPVQLQATISKTGDIENLKVVSGDAVLARSAVEAVRQWKYKPYYLNGDPVPIETQILVNFKLPN